MRTQIRLSFSAQPGFPLTKSFGRSIGLWQRTTSEGVTKAAPYLGCINHPALKERWLGGATVPTTLNGAPVRARACASLADAALYTTAAECFDAQEAVTFQKLSARVKQTRYGGTDCYHYGMVASGWTDIACEAGLKLHDYAALVPVLEGAGASITDWNGQPLALESETTVHGRVLACGDARVHAAAVKVLAG